MDKNKIKLKYLLGIWKSLPTYPSQEDIIYEIKSFLLKEGKLGGEFSYQNMKTIFGSDYENKDHGSIIKEMIQSGEIEEKTKGQQNKIWYKLKN
jgi:hypothetical protein